jgi:hypothetical protein
VRRGTEVRRKLNKGGALATWRLVQVRAREVDGAKVLAAARADAAVDVEEEGVGHTVDAMAVNSDLRCQCEELRTTNLGTLKSSFWELFSFL